jgi:hypothetical protein
MRDVNRSLGIDSLRGEAHGNVLHSDGALGPGRLRLALAGVHYSPQPYWGRRIEGSSRTPADGIRSTELVGVPESGGRWIWPPATSGTEIRLSEHSIHCSQTRTTSRSPALPRMPTSSTCDQWAAAVEGVQYRVGDVIRRAEGLNANYLSVELRFGW